MGGLFNYDSPLMTTLGKITDLVLLNVLTLIFCIPIVTIGASITACHYAALKIKRGEGYVFKSFWKSFKENLLQSTVIWFIVAINVVLCLFVVLFMNVEGTMGSVSKGILCAGLIFWCFVSCWVFPLQSKFINKIGATFKNAFFMSMKYIFRTILMVIICLIPVAALFLLTFQWYCLLLMFGISLPIYLCAMLYDKKFEELEDMIREREAEAAGEVNEDSIVETIETTEVEEGAN